MLLDAPGIWPTPVCLFRQGDVAWLRFSQIRNLLMRNVKESRLMYHVPKSETLIRRLLSLLSFTSTVQINMHMLANGGISVRSTPDVC